MKRTSTVLACIILILNLIAGSVSAADIYGSAEYKPLDMVVVVDTSGSMNYSDSTHMTSSAINMLINMMPAEESRLGIVTFNTKPTALTCDASGNPALLSLKEFDNVKNIKQKVSEIVYKGDTGIGNAIKMATDMLANGSNDSDRRKAILLFTDGVDDFGSDQLGLARCKENQGTAVQWATENKCPIYCIGYNYRTSSGGNSMGKNGEGITKLENIAKPTGGQAKAITNIKEIEDMFISMLANICDLYYKVVEVVPGDGKRHEVSIQVSPEVIEANVRITCATKDALSKGTIELYNPQNEKVALQNGNGIRYDVDATAASIKVLSPKTGTWTLVLDGITGEEIKIGLLEHYELGIVSKLTLPEGNPDGVGYIGDEIGVQAYLTTDGSQVTDTAIYETITTARVVVTPRAAPEQQEIYALTFDGIQYNGSFTIPLESVYDVTVELGSESFIRTDSLVIQSNNHPLVLDKNIENVKLNKNKQIVISDIYTYVSDPEQDAITAEVTNLTDPDMAKVEIKDDQIIIDGLGWGATNATVTYTDAHGNTVTSTFKVSVNDPVAWAIIVGSIILVVALSVWLLILAFRSRLYLFGKIVVCEISEGVVDIAGNFKRNANGFSYTNPQADPNVNPVQENGILRQSNVGQGTGIFGQNNAGQGTGIFGQNNAGQVAGIFDQSNVGQVAGIFEQNNAEQGNGIFGQNNVDTELEISNQYNEAYNFGNRKQKKTTLESILSGFLTNYSDFMNQRLHGNQSEFVNQIKQRLSNISVQTSKMFLHGTIGGKGGAVLKVNKGLLKKESIKVMTPRLEGNRAELPYYKKGVVDLDFVVILDNSGDLKNSIRVRAKLQRN